MYSASRRGGSARSRLVSCLFVLPILLCLAINALGQSSDGAIRGLLTDPSGAVVPGAQVEATHAATNTTFTTTTTSEGIYLFSNLPIGEYKVVVDAKGFKKSTSTVSVLTGTTTPLNTKLELGTGSQEVTVNATYEPVLRVDTAENATLQETKALLDLPSQLGGNFDPSASGRRQITSFLFLTPGVVGAGFNHSTNGAPDLSSEVIIDGVPYSQQETPGYIDQSSPPFESVAEFKNSNSIFPPEYGRGFGVEIYTFKSGTNRWHGDAFEFLRNQHLDARGFYSPTVPTVHQNDFGGTVGGPIKKDKLFFFMAWDEIRVGPNAAGLTLDTLPTQAMRQGDFTGYPLPIYDPTTTEPDGAGGFTRTQFSCGGTLNVICDNRISPIAKTMLGLLPPPDNDRLTQNFVSRTHNSAVTDRVPMWKVDYNLNQKNHISGSLWRTWNPAAYTYKDFGSGQALDSGNPNQPGWLGGYRGNWDYLASAHVVNHFGFGNETLIGGRGIDPRHGNETLKIPGIPADAPGYPAFYVAGMPEMGNADQINNPRVGRYWIINDTVTITHGRHEMKFGGEFWKQYQWEEDMYSGGAVGGTFNFGNLETSLPDAQDSHGNSLYSVYGSSIASWLVGAVDNGLRQVNPLGNRRDWNLPYFSLYAQDKIQITQKLLLDIGLRWEVPSVFRDNEEGMSAVNLNLPNPAAGGRLGAYVFGNSRVLPPVDLREFGPRLGLTYRFNDKTVGRIGFATNYSAGNASGLGNRQWGNAYVSGYNPTQFLTTSDNGIHPAFYLDAGFPAYPHALPYLDPTLNVGGVADYYNPGGAKQPQMNTWTADVERELPHGIMIDAAWIGNHGVHIPAGLENLNQVPATWLGLGDELRQDASCLTSSPSACPNAVAAGVKLPYPGFTGYVNQALRPYPQYATIQDGLQPSGQSWYNALQTKVQKRFSEHLSFLAAYTWSKLITTGTGGSGYAAFNSTALDTANRGLEKTLGSYNYPHNLVINWVYQIPFAEHSSRFVKGVAGGWEIGGVFKGTSGGVVGIGGGPSMPLFGGGNRPNRVGGVDEKGFSGGFDPNPSSNPMRYFNAAAFSQPNNYTFGNVSPTESSIRNFAFWNTDLSLIKRTAIPLFGDAGSIEFRAEGFNLWNQVQFGGANANFNDLINFGLVSSQANQPRVFQLGLKLLF